MIFASIGSMLPFDRFVQGDRRLGQGKPVAGGFPASRSGRRNTSARHAPFTRMIPHGEYRRRLETCDLFVAHVGMGSILQSLELRKQLLMLPRLASLKEHTTDHQLHTAARFREVEGLLIVDDTGCPERPP